MAEVLFSDLLHVDGKPCLDAKYGPWDSIEDFKAYIEDELLTDYQPGTRFAVKEGGKLVEYWNPDPENPETFTKAGGGSDIEIDTEIPAEPTDDHVLSAKAAASELAKKLSTEDAEANYAKKAELEDYAKESDLEADYAKKAELEDYAKKAELEDYAKKAELEDYAKKAELDDYAKKAELDDYAKKAALDSKLNTDAVNTTVNADSTDDTVPTSKAVYTAIQSELSDVLTQSDIEQALSTSETSVPSSALLNTQLASKLNTSDVLAEMPSTPTNTTVLGAQALADLLSGKLGTDVIDTTVPADPDDASDSHVPSTKSISTLANMLEASLNTKFDKDNIKTSWDMSEDDAHVPSAALVKSLVDVAEVTSNKVIDFSVEPAEGKYPDAKALYEVLTGKLNTSDVQASLADGETPSDSKVMSTKFTLAELDKKQNVLTLENATELVATLEDGSTTSLYVVTLPAPEPEPEP